VRWPRFCKNCRATEEEEEEGEWGSGEEERTLAFWEVAVTFFCLVLFYVSTHKIISTHCS